MPVCWAAGPHLCHTPLTPLSCLLAAAVPRRAVHLCEHLSSSKRTRWHGSRLSGSPWLQAGTGVPPRQVVETHLGRIATGSRVAWLAAARVQGAGKPRELRWDPRPALCASAVLFQYMDVIGRHEEDAGQLFGASLLSPFHPKRAQPLDQPQVDFLRTLIVCFFVSEGIRPAISWQRLQWPLPPLGPCSSERAAVHTLQRDRKPFINVCPQQLASA